MTRRSRILAFGSAALLVVAGAACAQFVSGVTGQVLTMALMLAGLGGGILLVFLEVGLGEDRDNAREEERRQRHSRPHGPPRRRLRTRRR